MLKYYPSNTVLKNKFLNLCGQHYGILESQILTSAQGKYTPKISPLEYHLGDTGI